MKSSAKIIGGIITIILLSTSVSQCVGSIYRAKLRDDRRIATQQMLSSKLNQTSDKLTVKEVTKIDSDFDVKLREIAKKVNEMLPSTSDTGRTDSVAILENRELRYYCTILDDNWKSTEEEQKELLLEKAQYANMTLFQIGHVTLSYAFYRNEECIMIVKLLPGEY